MRTRRPLDRPIITADLYPTIGANIQGPSMIRVPDWIGNWLGEYYLYFADHKGSYIRLAYADHPVGPWTVHPPGSLHLAQSHFLTKPPVASPEQITQFEARLKERDMPVSHDALSEITTPHIASPDVHVDAVGRRIVMYFHGLEDVATQVSRVAISHNGIDFEAQPEILGPSYLRIFPHDRVTYALAMPGQFFRSKDELHGFEPGPVRFNPNMRHSAVLKRGNELLVGASLFPTDQAIDISAISHFGLLRRSHVDRYIFSVIWRRVVYHPPMYIEAVPNRGSPPAILLRESYREGGKSLPRRRPGSRSARS